MEVGLTRTEVRKRIIADVLIEYDIDDGTLLGPGRTDHVVDARISAARRLRSAGFSVARIADILKRDHTTISYYFNDAKRCNKRDRLRLSRRHRTLPDNVLAVVKEFAERDGVSVVTILAEWISERARYEIEARARNSMAAA